jgi:hypothetical protein
VANRWDEGDKQPQATKDKIRAENLSQRLEQFVAGEIELSQAQVSAAKVLIDKGKPSLQAVSQSQEDPMAGRTEEELLEQIRDLISSRPELLAGVKHLVEPVKDAAAPQEKAA